METQESAIDLDAAKSELSAVLRKDIEEFDRSLTATTHSPLRGWMGELSHFGLAEEVILNLHEPEFAERTAQKRRAVIMQYALAELEEWAAKEHLMQVKHRLKANVQKAGALFLATKAQPWSDETIWSQWTFESLVLKAISRTTKRIDGEERRPDRDRRERSDAFPKVFAELSDRVKRLADDQTLSGFVEVHPFRWAQRRRQKSPKQPAQRSLWLTLPRLIGSIPAQCRFIPTAWASYPATVRVVELSQQVEQLAVQIEQEHENADRALSSLRIHQEDVASALQAPQRFDCMAAIDKRQESLVNACLALEPSFALQRNLALTCEKLQAAIPQAMGEYQKDGVMEGFTVYAYSGYAAMATIFRAVEQLEAAIAVMTHLAGDDEASSCFEIGSAIKRQLERTFRAATSTVA